MVLFGSLMLIGSKLAPTQLPQPLFEKHTRTPKSQTKTSPVRFELVVGRPLRTWRETSFDVSDRSLRSFLLAQPLHACLNEGLEWGGRGVGEGNPHDRRSENVIFSISLGNLSWFYQL